MVVVMVLVMNAGSGDDKVGVEIMRDLMMMDEYDMTWC